MNLADILSSVPLLSFRCPDPQDLSTMGQGLLSSFVVDVDDQKIIVTAAHFPDRDRSKDFKAQFTDPPMKIGLSLAVRQYDEADWWDVALLYADEPASLNSCKPLKIAEDTTFSVGDEAYMLGYPFSDILKKNYGLTSPLLVVKKGVVAAKIPRRDGKAPLVILDSIWDTGMSGGPVIHAATGNVIGVVSSRPMVDDVPIEIVTSPSGDQILEVIREHL